MLSLVVLIIADAIVVGAAEVVGGLLNSGRSLSEVVGLRLLSLSA